MNLGVSGEKNFGLLFKRETEMAWTDGGNHKETSVLLIL